MRTIRDFELNQARQTAHELSRAAAFLLEALGAQGDVVDEAEVRNRAQDAQRLAGHTVQWVGYPDEDVTL